MTVYAIAALKFTDRDVFQPYSWTLLAADEGPLVVGGVGQRQGRGVVVPEEPAVREGAESPDYQSFSGDRHRCPDTVMLVGQELPRKD